MGLIAQHGRGPRAPLAVALAQLPQRALPERQHGAGVCERERVVGAARMGEKEEPS